MKVKDLIAVSAMPGVFKLIGSRKNGIIVENLDTAARLFVPSRGHNFSPLETIAVYTDTDTVPLKQVFQNMYDAMEKTPPVSGDVDEKTLRAYFEAILPEYDRDRVRLSDIKKIVKWFGFIHQRGYTTMEDEVPAPAADAADTTTA